MKKFKNLFIITLCFAFVFTTINVPSTDGIIPYGHLTQGTTTT